MNVLDVEVDIYKYNVPNYTGFSIADFHIQTEYIDEHSYYIVVRRLDDTKGWNDAFDVLVEYTAAKKTAIIHIDTSPISDMYVKVEIADICIQPSTIPVYMYSRYTMISPQDPQKLSREEFNLRFSTDIATLPRQLYAVGCDNDTLYMYNEYYADYWDVLVILMHIMRVALTFTDKRHFYFIICCGDGYMEKHYISDRTKPYNVGQTEYVGKAFISMENSDEFPVFHSPKYILAQSNQKGMSYVIDIPDRHYFFCNFYNAFRSFHRGIPFSEKRNQIVYGSRRERGSKYNFLKCSDINTNQREYFYSDAVPKDNIVCSTEWIPDYEMVEYKYILDIDGVASTWDGTAWKLNSGSVIFKTNSCWRQWFYDEYLPWVHYVPVEDDFSDLQEKYHWCEANQPKCEEIIKNARALFQKVYRFHNVIEYTKNVIDRIQPQS